MTAVEQYIQILERNRAGAGTGVYSICSAHPTVLRAAMLQARDDRSILLIESTSNQVDQFGGYTGMQPKDFVARVHQIADSVGFSREQVLLGGDHLGPNSWQHLPSEQAMSNALTLIAEYVKAGYQKIHLDASMFCADDAGDRHGPLPDEVVASRAAAMAKVAEETHAKFCPGEPKPVYIIGTEVPVPGGAQGSDETVTPTQPEDVARTIETARTAFMTQDLEAAWQRVYGVVVQPGVEFGDDQVHHYDRSAASGLSQAITRFERFVYEAHSTDYQTKAGLSELVQDHYCILKVGPWLTFGYREAIFALAMIEAEMLRGRNTELSKVCEAIDEVMVAEPKYWQKYYTGSASELAYKRKYSFSDRVRYYWPNQKIQAALRQLIVNLSERPISLSLLSQYMPRQYAAVSEGRLANDVEALILDRTREVVATYAEACRLGN